MHPIQTRVRPWLGQRAPIVGCCTIKFQLSQQIFFCKRKNKKISQVFFLEILGTAIPPQITNHMQGYMKILDGVEQAAVFQSLASIAWPIWTIWSYTPQGRCIYVRKNLVQPASLRAPATPFGQHSHVLTADRPRVTVTSFHGDYFSADHTHSTSVDCPKEWILSNLGYVAMTASKSTWLEGQYKKIKEKSPKTYRFQ